MHEYSARLTVVPVGQVYIAVQFQEILECILSFLSHFRALVPPHHHCPGPSELILNKILNFNFKVLTTTLTSFPNLTRLVSPYHRHATACVHDVQQFVCAICGSRFGRTGPGFKAALELKDRRCPFCDFEWARPDKIKHHIPMHLPDRFTAEVMAISQDLHGKNVVAFLDDLDHDSRSLVWR